MIKNNRQKKWFVHKCGKTYFSSATERNFYFLLTIIMLLIGLVVKTGLI